MFEKIKDILAVVKEEDALRETITPKSDLINEIGIDSLQMIQFILMVEEAFRVEISYEDLDFQYLLSVEAFMRFLEGMEPRVG
jgi:acyl carrier protein